MKRFKRTMATALCILTLSQGIYADGLIGVQGLEVEVEMDSSILKVDEVAKIARKQLEIPKEYTLEDSSFSTDDYYLKKVWELVFEVDDRNIKVSVDAETGKIVAFDKWERSDKKVLKYTQDQARKVAEKYINDNYSNLKNQLVELDGMRIDKYHSRDNHMFIYARKLNNEIFKNNYIAISVSGITGEITGFQIIWDDTNYTKKSNEISEKEARAIFEKEDAIKLKYIHVDREDNKIITLKPVYYYEKIDSGLLDSVTKKFYSNEDIYSYNNDTIAYNEAAKESGGYGFDMGQMVPEEGSISREQVQKTVIEKLSKLIDTKNLEIRQSVYQNYHNGINGKYWNIILENNKANIYVNATLDAISSKVLSIDYSEKHYAREDFANSVKQESISKEVAKSLQEKAENIIGDMFAEIDKNNYVIDEETPSQDENKIYIKGTRVIDNIEYNTNGFSMEFDAKTEKLVRFSFDWSYNIKVEKPKKMITKKEASKIFYNKVGFEKELVQLKDKSRQDKENVILPLKDLALVYKLNPYRFSYVDVENGKLLAYSGEEYKNDDEAEYFTDIKGNKYEQSIKLMKKMGFIREANDKFSPNAVITKKDAIKWIVLTLSGQYRHIPSAKRNYYINGDEEISFKDIDKDDEYYEYVVRAVNMNIIKDGKYFNKNHKVTVMEMIKYIIRGMGQKELAEYTDIFVKEQGVIDKDRGYIGLAKYYNIIEDKTNITQTKTRAEIIDVLYDFITELENGSK